MLTRIYSSPPGVHCYQHSDDTVGLSVPNGHLYLDREGTEMLISLLQAYQRDMDDAAKKADDAKREYLENA